MKCIFLSLILFFSIACGGSSGGGNKASNNPNQEQITQSVNSPDGQLLMSTTWCAESRNEDQDGNEYYFQIKLKFLKSGEIKTKVIDLDTRSTIVSLDEYWYILDDELVTTDGSDTEVSDFFVTESYLYIISTYEEDDGSSTQIGVTYEPCF